MENIFLTVLNMTITSSAIIIAVMIIRFFLRKMPRKYSYILWIIPAIRLLCPVSISSILSVFNIFRPAVNENKMEYIQIPQPLEIQQNNDLATFPENIPYQTIPTKTTAAAENYRSFAEIASAVWFSAAIIVVIWAIINYILVCRRVKNSEKADGYFLCKNIPSPFVLGVFDPKIYIPAGISDIDINCILMHERTHIKRRDHILKLLTIPVLALHWFNPIIWLGIRLMTADMELSCDEYALQNMSEQEKKNYANALLNVSMKQNHISFGGVLGFGESDIKSRIKGIFKTKKPKLQATIIAAAVIIIAAICLLTNAKTDDITAENILSEETSAETSAAITVTETSASIIPVDDTDDFSQTEEFTETTSVTSEHYTPTEAEKLQIQDLLEESRRIFYDYVLGKEMQNHVDWHKSVTILITDSSGESYNTKIYEITDGDVLSVSDMQAKMKPIFTEEMIDYIFEECNYYYYEENGRLYVSDGIGSEGGGAGIDTLHITSMEKLDEDTFMLYMTSFGAAENWDTSYDIVDYFTVTLKRTESGFKMDKCGPSGIRRLAWCYDPEDDVF